MVKIFNKVNEFAEKIVQPSHRVYSANDRVIIESNGSVRANYDNEDVRRDLFNEINKFAHFQVTDRE